MGLVALAKFLKHLVGPSVAGEELHRVVQTLQATRKQQQRIELQLEERKTELAKCHDKLAYLRFWKRSMQKPEQSSALCHQLVFKQRMQLLVLLLLLLPLFELTIAVQFQL
eukprot:1824601-Amphidinium_carterae.1